MLGGGANTKCERFCRARNSRAPRLCLRSDLGARVQQSTDDLDTPTLGSAVQSRPARTDRVVDVGAPRDEPARERPLTSQLTLDIKASADAAGAKTLKKFRDYVAGGAGDHGPALDALRDAVQAFSQSFVASWRTKTPLLTV